MTTPFYSPCTLGLEEVLEQELRELGAGDIERERGGVHWSGDVELGYRASLWLRSAIRVQELLAYRDIGSERELYRFVSDGDWLRLMDVSQTLAVDSSVRDSFLTHSLYASQVVKDAIVDQFRARKRARPSVDTRDPDLPVRLLLRRDRAFLYRDWSGQSLHKRGYRPIQVKSPLNEATAAGLLMLTGWDRRSPLLDPMCGSGTFLIEAAWLAGDRAPGLDRRFPFQRWPDFEPAVWRGVVREARARAESGGSNIPAIQGADRHSGSLSLAKRAVGRAGLDQRIVLTESPVAELVPAERPSVIITNPPYGERIGEGDDLIDSWRDLGAFLHRSEGSTAFVLSGNPELSQYLGLRSDRRWRVRNGPIDCRLLRYEISEHSDEQPAVE